jgi:hypothetical protein
MPIISGIPEGDVTKIGAPIDLFMYQPLFEGRRLTALGGLEAEDNVVIDINLDGGRGILILIAKDHLYSIEAVKGDKELTIACNDKVTKDRKLVLDLAKPGAAKDPFLLGGVFKGKKALSHKGLSDFLFGKTAVVEEVSFRITIEKALFSKKEEKWLVFYFSFKDGNMLKFRMDRGSLRALIYSTEDDSLILNFGDTASKPIPPGKLKIAKPLYVALKKD